MKSGRIAQLLGNPDAIELALVFQGAQDTVTTVNQFGLFNGFVGSGGKILWGSLLPISIGPISIVFTVTLTIIFASTFTGIVDLQRIFLRRLGGGFWGSAVHNSILDKLAVRLNVGDRSGKGSR